MKTRNIAILILLVFSACNLKKNHDVTTVEEKTQSTNPIVQGSDDVDEEIAPWANLLIQQYIDSSITELRYIHNAPITYFKQYINQDGKVYLVAQIGHSFEDKYISDRWLYIDAITKNMYVYDLQKDTLIGWPIK